MSQGLTRDIDKQRWITLMLILIVGATSAFLNCLSVYIAPLAERGWDPSVVVVAYTLMMFMSIPGSIIGGKIQEKCGNKLVLKVCGLGFLLSLVVGSFSVSAWMYVILIGGFAPLFVYCIYVAQIGNIGALFPERKGFVTGALMVGIYGIGAILVPLASNMTAGMGVMPGIAVLGVVIGGFTILSGFLIVEAPEGYAPKGWESKEYEAIGNAGETTSVDTPWKRLLTLKSFWILFIGQIAMAIFCAGAQSSFVLMTMNVTGCSDATAAWSYSVFAIIMGCSGLVIGFLSDKLWGPIKWMAYTALVAAAFVTIFVITGSTSFGLYMVFVVILGIAVGTSTTLLAVVLMGAYGTKFFGVNFGIFQFAMLISSYVGPQLAVGENINMFFIVGAIGLIFGAIVFLIGGAVRNKELGFKIF